MLQSGELITGEHGVALFLTHSPGRNAQHSWQVMADTGCHLLVGAAAFLGLPPARDQVTQQTRNPNTALKPTVEGEETRTQQGLELGMVFPNFLIGLEYSGQDPW